MRRYLLISLVLTACVGAQAFGAEDDEKEALTPEQRVELARQLRPHFCRLEITLQPDKGEQPYGGRGSYGLSNYLEEERPMEMWALVVAPDRVLCADPSIHPRFVESMQVRCGDQLVDAEPAGYPIDHPGAFFKLAEPLEDAEPVEFDAELEGPYLAVSYREMEGRWSVGVMDFAASGLVLDPDGRAYRSADVGGLIVDEQGRAVGMVMKDELPVDDSWKGSPADWEQISAEKLDETLTLLEEAIAAGVMRVKLNFRSPRKKPGMSPYDRMGGGGETEITTLGGLVDDTRVLISQSLKPKVTARLERIRLFPPEGDPIEAEFAHTLKDYGALVATLPEPSDAALPLADGEITDYRDELLLHMELKLQGDQLTLYGGRSRIDWFRKGRKGRIYPSVSARGENVLLFDTKGRLVAMPMSWREKVTMGGGYYGGGGGAMIPVMHLDPVLANIEEHSDPSNVPLTEAEENRLAWLGVELQSLDAELARMREISDLTRGGQIGAIVSYVYEGSPADEAGLEVGDILLRLHVPDEPKPIEISINEYMFSRQPFPWDRLGELPEQYYDQIPSPWPPVENQFTRALTDLGFGKEFSLEYLRGREAHKEGFEVVESPPRFYSAPKYKAEDLGITVRDMTYEVRRYFRKDADEPGVVVAKVEPGSKASVAGIKPYEVITHVNDEPVKNAESFGELIAVGGELRLAVKRMTKGRVVKVEMEGGEDGGEEEAPADDGRDAEGAAAPAAEADGTPEDGSETPAGAPAGE